MGQGPSCSVDDRQSLPYPAFNVDAPGTCPIIAGSRGHIKTEEWTNEDFDTIQNYCDVDCGLMRQNEAISCNAYLVQLIAGPTTTASGVSNSWRCDYWSTLPANLYSTACTATDAPLLIRATTRDAVNSCFHSSLAAASQFCSSYIRMATYTPFVTTYYSSTIAGTPSTTTATGTNSLTTTTTTTVRAESIVTIPIVTTSYITETTKTITIQYLTSVIQVPTVTKVLKTVTRTTTTTPIATVKITSSVCKLQPREVLEKRTGSSIPEPSCLSQSNLPIPASVISSACSCLFPTITTTTTKTFTSLISSTPSTSTNIQITVTDRSPATSTRALTTTVTSYARSLTTVTKISTYTSITSRVTYAVKTSTVINTITLTATAPAQTRTVTNQVAQPAIQTFGLYARPVGNTGTTKWRFFSRSLDGAQNDRVLQYQRSVRKTDGAFTGVNATITNDGGRLCILSQANNLQPYGPTVMLIQGQDKGRKVLGLQQDTSLAALQGYTVTPGSGVVSCNGSNGKPVVWQQLSWPTTDDQGRSILGVVPSGGSGYKPLMELVAADFGSVQVGCK